VVGGNYHQMEFWKCIDKLHENSSLGLAQSVWRTLRSVIAVASCGPRLRRGVGWIRWAGTMVVIGGNDRRNSSNSK
jgi:hypothetical protein